MMRDPIRDWKPRGWECAFELLNNYAGRMSLDQCVFCEVVVTVAPERIPEPMAGAAIALFCQVVKARR